VPDVTDRLTEVFRTTFGDERLVRDPAMTAALKKSFVLIPRTSPAARRE